LTFASDHPAPYTNFFLSTKEKYKPIAKKVHPAIGELPKKFCIECEIIDNPLDDLPILYPHSPPFVTTDLYTLEQQHQPHKNYPGSFWWPAEKDLMHYFMLILNLVVRRKGSRPRDVDASGTGTANHAGR
jgi:hypothetical protein